MIPTVESRFCPYVDKGAISNSVNTHSLTSTAIKNPPLLDLFYTRTMSLQYYGHSHPQTRYTSTPLEILLVAYIIVYRQRWQSSASMRLSLWNYRRHQRHKIYQFQLRPPLLRLFKGWNATSEISSSQNGYINILVDIVGVLKGSQPFSN